MQERHEPLANLLKGPMDTWKMLVLRPQQQQLPPPQPEPDAAAPARSFAVEAEDGQAMMSSEVVRERQVKAAVEARYWQKRLT